MIRGAIKFDGLTVAKVEISFLGTSLTCTAEAAFTNTQTGQTHGWTKKTQWSPTVLDKLKELRALMEADLGSDHMDGGGEVLAGPAAPARPGLTLEGGLGEHLRDDTVPQV